MGTKRKMKRVMSGGRGKISKYTQKFKRSYNRFVNIKDKGDVDSRFKKMDEWGRMRNIYNFLKIQNDKYKGSAGTETTAWEKMKDNDDYKSAISCFEQSDNHILSEGDKCIPEEDYRKGDTGARYEAQDNANDVYGKTEANTEVSDTGAADVSGETEDNTEVSSANASDADNTENAAVVQPGTDDAAVVQPGTDDAASVVQSEADAVVQSEADAVVQSEAEAMKADDVVQSEADAEAMKAATDAEKQNGGRSKRKPKSSRRRGKSMKSKKGRKTRRKHRAGRH